jgi:hypothetical protein
MVTAKKKSGSAAGAKRQAKPRAKSDAKSDAKPKAKPKPRTTPSAAMVAPQRRWYEHPLASPVVWSVISAIVGGILYSGAELYRQAYELLPVTAPAPFEGDRVGILLARLENDPANEYALRVRSALEHQFPVAVDGSSSVEVNLYPKKLTLPEDGRLSETLAEANAEGREWLEEQKADLLIWGRALPTEKMLELRILTREADPKSSAQPELYPIKIPSEFSEQIGGALAGMVAGAGANAWNQRGGYLSPARAEELAGWMARLKTLQNELPDTLDEDTRAEIRTKIRTAYAQIGATLLADGNSPLALQVLSDLFPADEDEDAGGILKSHPFLASEIIADIVSQFSAAAVGQMGPEEDAALTTLIEQTSDSFEKSYEAGDLGKIEYAYLSALMAKLAGEVQAKLGQQDESKANLIKAIDAFDTVLSGLPRTHDALSRARIRSYLGEAQLALARVSDIDAAGALLDASIENFTAALNAVSPEVAPREAVRFGFLLATAEVTAAEWFVDVRALKRGIHELETLLPLLDANERDGEADGVRVQLANLLVADAIFHSGVAGAKKSLALLDEVAPSDQEDAAINHCASLEDDQRALCIRRHEVMATQQEATVQRGRCLANLAAGFRFDPNEDALSPEALDYVERSAEACEATAAAMLSLGNAAGWLEAQVSLADGLRLVGERSDEESPLEDALSALADADDKLAAIDAPPLSAQVMLTRAGASGALAVLQQNPAMLREAMGLELAARNIYSGREFAMQRLYAEMQYARSLTRLAELEKTDEGLTEATELLTNAKDRYAASGATLAARDAARALDEAEAAKARLATN